MLDRILNTRDDPSVLLIRLLVGPRGVPPRRSSETTVCGALVILGLLTRLAAIPVIIVMIVAIVSTKIPVFLGHRFLIFNLPHLNRYGFWSMLHEARADFCMLLGCLYLLIVGSGGWSLDVWLRKRRRG